MLTLPISMVALDRITASDITSYMKAREAKLKQATLRRELTIMKHCFQVARMSWNIRIPSDPFEAVKTPRSSPPWEQRIEEIEAETICRAISKCRNPLVRQVFQFALETGMRRGEILALRWADADLQSRTAYTSARPSKISHVQHR